MSDGFGEMFGQTSTDAFDGLLQICQVLAVVLAFDVTLNGKRNTLNVLNTTAERQKSFSSRLLRLVARIASIGTGNLGHQLGMTFVHLARKTFKLAKHVCNLVSHALQTVVKIGELISLSLDSTGIGVRESLWGAGELVELFNMLTFGLDIRLLTADGVCGRSRKLVDLERVGVLRSSSRDTKEVTRRKVDLLAVEAGCAVDVNAETVSAVLDAQLAWSTQIAVCVIAMTKGQTVNVVVVLEVGRAVVQETTNRASTRTVLINDQSKTVEFADCIYTALTDSRTTSINEPEVQVSTTTLLTRSTELGLDDPFGLGDGIVGEDSTSCTAGSRRCEDDAI